jgi:ankyrin repeat protein
MGMKILLKVSRIVLAAGLALLAAGILLTVGPKVPLPFIDSPEPEATSSLLAGTLLVWIGCVGLAATLELLGAALAGILMIVGSLLLPWLLHAVGVVWWSRLLELPVFTLFLAGCILLAIAVVRLLIRGPWRTGSAALFRLRAPKHWSYLRAVVIGLLLGLPVWLCLTPPPFYEYQDRSRWILTREFTADFDWYAARGFTAFKIRDSGFAGGFLWERLVAFQIKPRLDSWLRLTNEPRLKGWGGVKVLKVIPLAFPGGWGSDDMGIEDLRQTPLMHAAANGDLKLVRNLLSEGADVNARDTYCRTALMHAFDHGKASPPLVHALLAAGADPNARDIEGETALSPALITVNRRDRPTIIGELVQAHADVNVRTRESGRSPLMSAVSTDPDTVRILLLAGADVNTKNNEGNTPVLLAVKDQWTDRKDRFGIVTELLSAHADVNARNNDGETALITATAARDDDLVKALLAARADVNVRDNSGRTALSVAQRGGYVEIVEWLKQAGAKE